MNANIDVKQLMELAHSVQMLRTDRLMGTVCSRCACNSCVGCTTLPLNGTEKKAKLQAVIAAQPVDSPERQVAELLLQQARYADEFENRYRRGLAETREAEALLMRAEQCYFEAGLIPVG